MHQNNYCLVIFQEKNNFIPKAMKKANSKANSPKENINADIRKVKFEEAQETSSIQKSISKKKEKEIKNFLVAELNRQEQVKEIKTMDARQRQRQEETERLRKVSYCYKILILISHLW
jgi:cyanophycinase-like exopeptidase